MAKLMYKFVFAFAILITGSSLLTAEDYVTRSEYNALLTKVEQLDLEVKRMQNFQVEAVSDSVMAAMPKQVKEDPALIKKVVDAMHVREQAINYPWMDESKWALLTKGMSPGEVVDILGLPTLDEPSMHKRVDFVYTYQGRQPSTNKRVKGIVRFYKKKMIEIEIPTLD